MADWERLTFGEVNMLIRVSTPDVCVLEEVPPMVDTPRHVHEREDELFVSLEGEHVIELDGGSTGSPPGIRSSRRGAFPTRSAAPCPARGTCWS